MEKLSIQQTGALLQIRNDVSVPAYRIHGKIINKLYELELIRVVRYANGEFCELTDKGINAVSTIKY
jgi:hypothetical protein